MKWTTLSFKRNLACLDSATVGLLSLFIYAEKGDFLIPFLFYLVNVLVTLFQLKSIEVYLKTHRIVGQSRLGCLYDYLKWHGVLVFSSFLVCTGLHLLFATISVERILICLEWTLVLWLVNQLAVYVGLRRIL